MSTEKMAHVSLVCRGKYNHHKFGHFLKSPLWKKLEQKLSEHHGTIRSIWEIPRSNTSPPNKGSFMLSQTIIAGSFRDNKTALQQAKAVSFNIRSHPPTRIYRICRWKSFSNKLRHEKEKKKRTWDRRLNKWKRQPTILANLNPNYVRVKQ